MRISVNNIVLVNLCFVCSFSIHKYTHTAIDRWVYTIHNDMALSSIEHLKPCWQACDIWFSPRYLDAALPLCSLARESHCVYSTGRDIARSYNRLVDVEVQKN